MNLRRASTMDGYALWLWANDAGSRAASGDRPLIEWVTHLGWLERRLADSGTVLLIGESAAGQPVGTIRFESRDEWQSAVLSYAVAPEARGQGFGRALLVGGVLHLRRLHPAIRIEASVSAGNVRSLRLFRSLGWDERTSEDGVVWFVDRSEVAA